MMALNCQNCVQRRPGLGKMNSETPKPTQIACHSRMIAASSSQGDQRSMILLFFMPVLASWRQHGGRPRARVRAGVAADRPDVAAQLEHDVGEGLGVGELELARARQV